VSVYESGNPQEDRSEYSIAVVGGGAASVAFIKAFVDRIVSQHTKGIQLTLFEKKDVAGTGYPFQEDFEGLRLIAPSEGMSISAENAMHFTEWLDANETYRKMRMDNNYLPRRVYGDYLTDTLHTSMEKAKNYIKCEIMFKHVVDLHKQDNNQYEVITEEGQSFVFDFVLLAVGVAESDDHYQLMGQPGYIHRPYPAKVSLANIGKTDTVGILGTRLTAIDMALALRDNGHTGSMVMMSEKGQLPAMVDRRGMHEAKFCTVDSLNSVLEKNHEISLRHIVRLVRKEYKEAGLDWREVYLGKGKQRDDVESVRQNIASASDKEQEWLNILFGTLPAFLFSWKHVPEKDKQLLTQNHMHDAIQQQTPVPIGHAKQIYDLLLSEQLHIVEGIDAVHKQEQGFQVTFRDGSELTCDHIINATGYSRDVSKNDLIKNLLTKGYLVQDYHGGIEVDYDSSAVIDKDGKKQDTLRAVGYVTHGTYLIVTLLPLVAGMAYQVAQECAKLASAE